MSRSAAFAATCAVLAAVLTGCDSSGGGGGVVPGVGGGDAESKPPENGLCRDLEPGAIAKPTDDTDSVECSARHTAETFYVGELGDEATDLDHDAKEVDALVRKQCQPRYLRFTGATPSLALRTVVTWAWWGPGEDAWDDGARWYRCDVVGGTQDFKALLPLPKTAKGLLLGIPGPRWLVCADGAIVADAARVACTEKHTWRAVSAVSIGKPKDKWPGERLVEVRSRDFCSDWVGAWTNYSLDYEFAYTWFGKADWDSGNRLTVCWAKTGK